MNTEDILQRYAEPSKAIKIPRKPMDTYSLFTVQYQRSPGAIIVELTLNIVPVSIVVDTVTAFSFISTATNHKIAQLSQLPLQKSNVILGTYSGECINIYGSVEVKVCYQRSTKVLRSQVIKREGPNLLG